MNRGPLCERLAELARIHGKSEQLRSVTTDVAPEVAAEADETADDGDEQWVAPSMSPAEAFEKPAVVVLSTRAKVDAEASDVVGAEKGPSGTLRRGAKKASSNETTGEPNQPRHRAKTERLALKDPRSRRLEFAISKAREELGPLYGTIANGLCFDHSVLVYIDGPETLDALDERDLNDRMMTNRRRALDFFDEALANGEDWATIGSIADLDVSVPLDWEQRRSSLTTVPTDGGLYKFADEQLLLAYTRCFQLHVKVKVFSVSAASRLPKKVTVNVYEMFYPEERQQADDADCPVIVMFEDQGSSFKGNPRHYEVPMNSVAAYHARKTALAPGLGSSPLPAQKKGSTTPPARPAKRTRNQNQ